MPIKKQTSGNLRFISSRNWKQTSRKEDCDLELTLLAEENLQKAEQIQKIFRKTENVVLLLDLGKISAMTTSWEKNFNRFFQRILKMLHYAYLGQADILTFSRFLILAKRKRNTRKLKNLKNQMLGQKKKILSKICNKTAKPAYD